MKNVIILTSGHAGSSVLASLIQRAGFWSGERTCEKPDYNTMENEELVSLDEQLLQDAGFKANWAMVYRDDYIARITAGTDQVDETPYAAFVKKCDGHSPWLWKDPCLWLTIRYWRRFIDLQNTVFIVVRRDNRQGWISCTFRRQIQSLSHHSNYNDKVYQNIHQFLQAEGVPFLDVLYEDILRVPEDVIVDINDFLSTKLTLADFKAIYRGGYGRKKYGAIEFVRAWAIYQKITGYELISPTTLSS